MWFSLGRGAIFKKNRLSKLGPQKRAPGGGSGRLLGVQNEVKIRKMRFERPIKK